MNPYQIYQTPAPFQNSTYIANKDTNSNNNQTNSNIIQENSFAYKS